MKLIIDIPEKDWKFMRETYKGTGFSFVLSAIKNECVNAVYNGTPYEERKMGKWNVITKRPMTENERSYYNEEYDYNLLDDEAVIYNNLPDDDVEVLICTRYGFVFIDTLLRSGGCVYFDREGDLDDVVAWMPLPEPYREVDE